MVIFKIGRKNVGIMSNIGIMFDIIPVKQPENCYARRNTYVTHTT